MNIFGKQMATLNCKSYKVKGVTGYLSTPILNLVFTDQFYSWAHRHEGGLIV